MRIKCSLQIGNRELPSLGFSSKRKIHTSLSLGRHPSSCSEKGTLFVLVCNMQNKNGTKYKVRGNIPQVFAKFADEGKATICFKDPPHDLIISDADKIQLKGFLSALKLSLQGNGSNVKLSSLKPASSAQVTKPKTKLVIMSRKDYPLTMGFPTQLQTLRVNTCNLRRIDTRIPKLKNLTFLDLSSNEIKDLPIELNRLTNLAELYLQNNQIETFPVELCTANSLQKSLCCLDMSNNELQTLPDEICELKSLVTLRLNHNKLTELPKNMGNLMSLQFFMCLHNQLTSLPGSIIHLSLESLDLYGNPFHLADDNEDEGTEAPSLNIPTLTEISARLAKKYEIFYSAETVPMFLCHYLDSAKMCLCGCSCFERYLKRTLTVDVRHIARSVASINDHGNMRVPITAILCSIACYRRYCNRPNRLFR